MRNRRRDVAVSTGYWLGPGLVLTAIVLCAWTGLTGNRMSLGGDDSHLYYLDPWTWIRHAPLIVVDNMLAGINARTFFVPFVGLIGILSWLPVNPQGLAYGLLLAGTWGGVARLALELLPPEVPGRRPSAQVAAAVTTLAPIIAATQWTHQLYPIYWMAALPWLLVFVLAHQRDGRWRWVWAAVALTVSLAPAMNAVAWTGACLLLAVPLFVIGMVARRTPPKALRLVGFALAVVGVNYFWIGPTLASAVGGQVQYAGATSTEGKTAAVTVVRSLARLQEPRDTIAMRMSSHILERYSSPKRVPNQWSDNLHLMGLAIPGLVIGGLVVAMTRRGAHFFRIIAPLAALWVVFLWLTTVGLFPGGTALFEYLTVHVPGWTAFRNFFDKFAIPYALVGGLTCGVAFAALTMRLTGRQRALAGVAAVLAAGVYSLPMLKGDYFRLPYFGDSPTNRVLHGLPADYRAMLDRVEELPPGAVLTVPLRRPAWTLIPAESNAAYLGLSPVNLLTGRSDLNGIAVIPNAPRSAVGPVLRDVVTRGDIPGLAGILRELGVRFVITGPPGDERLSAHALLGRTRHAENSLWEGYVDQYAPRVVWRNDGYTIRAIKPGWWTPTLGLSARLPPGDEPIARASQGKRPYSNNCKAGLDWHEISPVHFRGTISGGVDQCSLVLRKLFDRGWEAKVSGQRLAPTRALGFANQFQLPNTAGDVAVEVRYRPQALVRQAMTGSALALAVLIAATARSCRRGSNGW